MSKLDYGNYDNWSEQDKKKHDTKIKLKSFLSAIGFIAVIAILLLIQRANDERLNDAYNAGYNLGYYVAFLEDDVVVSDGEIIIFTEDHINEALNFVKSEMSGSKKEYFEDGFEAGWMDGVHAAKKFPFTE